jgi:ATP/maltotriose-dependent transcriptional regulator MalT
MAAALWRLWHLRGPLAEGKRRLDIALRADERPTAARANALSGAAVIAIEGGGDVTEARHRMEEALALHRGVGDAFGTAWSEFLLAQATLEEGDLARARQLFDESGRRFRELGDQNYALMAAFNLAVVSEELGERANARALHEDTLRQARALSSERIMADTLGSLAMMAVEEGRGRDAISLLRESLLISRRLDDLPGIAVDLRRIAHALAIEGEVETATWLLSGSEALREELGYRPSWVTAGVEMAFAAIHTRLDDDAFARAWEGGRALTVDEAMALALDSGQPSPAQ